MAQPQRAEQSASPGARWLLAETGTHTPHCMGPWVLCVTAPPHQSRTLLPLLFDLAAATVEFAGDFLHFLSSL